MGKIFISYSRRDVGMVDPVVEKIESEGLDIWIDREAIRPGDLWRTQIVQAIDTCDALILMLSSNSAASDNVRKEIDLAQDSGRTIFVMRLDEVKLPANIRYQLAGLQYVDLHLLGFDRAVKQLVETLKERSKPFHEPLVRQAELVFERADRAESRVIQQKQVLDLVSTLTETPEAQLNIAKATDGTHVYVDMPAAAAFKLKTRALNQDRRLKQFGIKSLRLVGDEKYVNVPLGILSATPTLGILQSLWMNIPSLFPSLFGMTAGKIILVTSTVVVTTAAGITASGVIMRELQSAPTPPAVTDHPILDTGQGTSPPTQARSEILPTTSTPNSPITPSDDSLLGGTSTPTTTRTPAPTPSRTPPPTPTLTPTTGESIPLRPTSTATPADTSMPTATPTPTNTPTDTPIPTDTPTPTDMPGPQNVVIGQNIVGNASFEEDPSTNGTLWFIDTLNSDLVANWSVETARTGSHSLFLSASRPGQQGWPGWFTTDTIPIADGYTYTFSAWEFTPDGAGAWLEVFLLDANGSFLMGYSTGCYPSPILNSWEFSSVSFSNQDAPGATQVRLGLQQCLTFTEGSVTSLFYDDVFFGVAVP